MHSGLSARSRHLVKSIRRRCREIESDGSIPLRRRTPDHSIAIGEAVPRKQKSPQEKKRESYEKDRRNTYGENATASRKLIPKRKAIGSRALRHMASQALASAVALGDPEVIDALEARLKRKRRLGWTKSPDKPLKEVIPRKRERRAALINRKKTQKVQ